MVAYYNEIDPAVAHVLRTQIDLGIIAFGEVDTRSIKEVTPSDLKGFTQCHFFAGGGLWSVAARMAGWPDERPLWTGSCPCQPFSAAGKQLGTDDPRHLWPDFHSLISAGRPDVVMGEQVAGAAGRDWFDGVSTDLEAAGFVPWAVDVPACSVNAPHQRNRIYWCAINSRILSYSGGVGCSQALGEPGDCYPENRQGATDSAERIHFLDGSGAQWVGTDAAVDVEHSDETWQLERGGRGEGVQSISGRRDMHSDGEGIVVAYNESISGGSRFCKDGTEQNGGLFADGNSISNWHDAIWIKCHDGKARRAKSDIRMLVDGVPGRVHLWSLAGNAIVPQVAAEVIRSFMETESQMFGGRGC